MSSLHKKYVAAVDIGTNSFHLIIAEVDKEKNIKIIEREREVIRLASHQGNELSHISNGEMEKAVITLLHFKKLAEKHNAKLRAVATSAVREADNKEYFLSEIFSKTGIKIEVIDGREEAKLIFSGVQKALPINVKNVLCVDIGGGSAEFIYAEKGNIIFAESIKIGAVRLSRKFFPDYIINDLSQQKCENYIEEKLKENSTIDFNIPIEVAVGSSGTIQSAAMMINYQSKKLPVSKMNGFNFSAAELNDLLKKILSLKTKEERLSVEGLENKRADIIPAGLLILKKCFELFGIKDMIISEYALREGILLDASK